MSWRCCLRAHLRHQLCTSPHKKRPYPSRPTLTRKTVTVKAIVKPQPKTTACRVCQRHLLRPASIPLSYPPAALSLVLTIHPRARSTRPCGTPTHLGRPTLCSQLASSVSIAG